MTADGMMRVRSHGQIVAEIPSRELADEAPLYDRPHTMPMRRAPMEAPPLPAPDVQTALPALLAAPDICFKRWIWEQYDYQVRTNTIAGPGAAAIGSGHQWILGLALASLLTAICSLSWLAITSDTNS